MIQYHVQGHDLLEPLKRHICIHAAHHGRVSLANSYFESGLTCGVLSVRV